MSLEKTAVLTESNEGNQLTLWGSLFVLVFFASYLTVKMSGGHFSVPHALFGIGVPALYFIHPLTRKLFVIALPVIAYGVAYDFFQYIPFDWLKPIHIQDIYEYDRGFLGLFVSGSGFHLHEWVFEKTAHPFWDGLCGLMYALHVPMAVILLFVFLAYRRDGLAKRFSMAFGIMNLMAFLTYLLYPVAAPWYPEKFGFIQPLAFVPGDPAGLARVDALLGFPFFTANYQISPITFGAVPSMHAGVCFLGYLYARQFGKTLGRIYFVYVALMWFSALYLQHHYFIDVLIGGLYALAAWFLVDRVFAKQFQACYRGLFRFFGVSGEATAVTR